MHMGAYVRPFFNRINLGLGIMKSYKQWLDDLQIEYKSLGEELNKTESELNSLYRIYCEYEPERVVVKKRILSRIGDMKTEISFRCGEILLEKVIATILSCKNQGQLKLAIKYADLACVRMSKTTGLINKLKFHQQIERSIGYTLCKIKIEENE